jgi:hypothetical protein
MMAADASHRPCSIKGGRALSRRSDFVDEALASLTRARRREGGTCKEMMTMKMKMMMTSTDQGRDGMDRKTSLAGVKPCEIRKVLAGAVGENGRGSEGLP